MSEEITLEALLEMGEELRKKVVASASPEERLAGLDAQTRVAGLKPAERVVGLKPEELRQLMQQIALFLGEEQAKDVSSPSED